MSTLTVADAELALLSGTAQELRALLSVAGESLDDALLLLREWAEARGMTNPERGSTKERVWLGDDIVVKSNLQIDDIDSVPEPYRPTQITVWEGRGKRWAWAQSDGDVAIVLQPRYVNLVDLHKANADTTPIYEATRTPATQFNIDGHANNWGLRADGSPVLFDF